MKVTWSCLTLCDPMDPSPWNSPGQNTGVGSPSLLQGIFLTQGLNPGLLQCPWILYLLSHQGSPRILEWVAYPFSSISSQPNPGIELGCPVLQVDSLTAELPGKPGKSLKIERKVQRFPIYSLSYLTNLIINSIHQSGRFLPKMCLY